MKNCSTVWVVTSIVIRSRHGVVFRHSLMFLLKPLQKQGKCHAFYNWRLFTVTKCSTHNENCLRHCWETVMGHHVHRWHKTGLIHSFIFFFLYSFRFKFFFFAVHPKQHGAHYCGPVTDPGRFSRWGLKLRPPAERSGALQTELTGLRP